MQNEVGEERQLFIHVFILLSSLSQVNQKNKLILVVLIPSALFMKKKNLEKAAGIGNF